MPDSAKNPPTGGRDPQRHDQACGLIWDVIAQRAHVETSVPHLRTGHAREAGSHTRGVLRSENP
jgi:hypothetical protein